MFDLCGIGASETEVGIGCYGVEVAKRFRVGIAKVLPLRKPAVSNGLGRRATRRYRSAGLLR